MKYFITGGAGFIGSNFIHKVLEDPNNLVINYDKLTYAGNLNNLKDICPKRHIFIHADITDIQTLKSALIQHSPDIIVNFSAESHVDRSIASPQEFLQTNVLGTESVLRAAKELKIKKVLHISTDEVYGSLDIPNQATEKTRFDPNSPYSVSKAAGDMLCHAYHVTYNLPVLVARGSNCYGPRQHPEKFIPKGITNLLQGKKLGIYGQGTNIREWIYVEDFCNGIDHILKYGVIGEAYNLGGGDSNRFTNNVIANKLCVLLGKTDDHIEYIEDRKGHDLRYAIDSTKLEKLGWRVNNNLAQGLSKTVDWYSKNDWWWKPLI